MVRLKKIFKTGSWPNLNEPTDFVPLGVDARPSASLDNISMFLKRMQILRKKHIIRRKFTMAERLEHAAPYNIFYNCLYEVPVTYTQPNSIQFIGEFYL